jgi:hypothetical protein
LYLSDKWYTVDPQAIWGWNGMWLPIAVLAVPWFWSRRREGTGWIYLAAVAPFVLAIVLNPFVLPLVEAKLGYLTMRFVWVIPVIPAVAAIITAFGRTVVRGRGARRAWRARARRVRSAAPASIGQGVTLLTERRRLFAEEALPRRRTLGGCSRVPARPLPRAPRSRVGSGGRATRSRLHGAPGDGVLRSALVAERSARSRTDSRRARAFSPYVDLRRTLTILRAYGVDAVVLNQRFEQPVPSDYWSMTPALYAPTSRSSGIGPDLFRACSMRRGPGCSNHGSREVRAVARLGGCRPAARSHPGVARRRRSARSLSDGLMRQYRHGIRAPRLRARGHDPHGDALEPDPGAPRPAPGNYMVFVRLESPVPRGPLYADAYDKLYRKALEKWTGRKWRLRTSHPSAQRRLLAGSMACGRDRTTTPTSFPSRRRRLPDTYTVRVKMVRAPHYVNTRVRDYFRDDDEFSGPVVGQLVIAPRTAAGATGAAR